MPFIKKAHQVLRELASESKTRITPFIETAHQALRELVTESKTRITEAISPTCEPQALPKDQRNSKLDGKLDAQGHFSRCVLQAEDYEEVLELVSDPTSMRTRAYHRIVITVSVTVILLWVWHVPIDEIRFLGVKGEDTNISNVLISISLLLIATYALYWFSWWIDRGNSSAKTAYAKEKIKKSAYHLSYIKQYIACGNRLATNAHKNINRNPDQNTPVSSETLQGVGRAIKAVNILKNRGRVNQIWGLADPVATGALCIWAIIILFSQLPPK